jgi:hypothetical protein
MPEQSGNEIKLERERECGWRAPKKTKLFLQKRERERIPRERAIKSMAE